MRRNRKDDDGILYAELKQEPKDIDAAHQVLISDKSALMKWIDKNLDKYTQLADYLNNKSARLKNENVNDASLDQRLAAINKLSEQLKQYLDHANAQLEAANNKLNQATKDAYQNKIAEIQTNKEKIEVAVEILKTAASTILDLRRNPIKGPDTQRNYYSSTSEQAIPVADTVAAMELVTRHLNAAPAKKDAPAISSGISESAPTRKATSADFTTRFIPHEIEIKARLTSERTPIKIAVVEEINKDKTYYKQTIHTAGDVLEKKLRSSSYKDNDDLRALAKNLVDTAKASVNAGKITLNGNWPPKLGILVVTYCKHMGYEYQAPKSITNKIDLVTGLTLAKQWEKESGQKKELENRSSDGADLSKKTKDKAKEMIKTGEAAKKKDNNKAADNEPEKSNSSRYRPI